MFRSLGIAVLTLGLASSVAPAKNLIDNGDFESGKSPWGFHADTIDNEFEVAGGVAMFNVRPTVNTQLFQAPLALRGGTEYELSFFASVQDAPSKRVQAVEVRQQFGPGNYKAAPNGSLLVAIAQHEAPFTNYGLVRQVNLSSTLKQYVYRFTTTPGDKNDARLRFMFNVQQGIYNYSIDDVVLLAANCGNGVLDDGEDCDDGDTRPGDGCDETCAEEFQISYGQADTDFETLTLRGRGLCTLDDPVPAVPGVFVGDASGALVPLPVLDNGASFILADISGITPLLQATHKVVVTCPGGTREIDVSVGTSLRTVTAQTVCTAAAQCVVTATCPAGEVVGGTWSFDGDLGAVEGGVVTAYGASSYTVSLQGAAGFDGATLGAQIRCAP